MKHLADIRGHFLSYFKGAGHEIISSSPLIPRNDPTLLFTNAGMVQFKDVFTGLEKRPYSRAATAQKCLRAGGKHNDLENVGYTARHHTFFEMLGNFSFGDYFKDVAIELAWTLITRDFGLAKDRLLVTVYADDNEAAQLWKKIAGLSDDRIIRIATNDNFWSMGDTGPCGPCSEIFYDHGSHIPGGPPGSEEAEGDRFVEIWNLVFMQFEQHADGQRTPLPKPSIDTGMGLERLGTVLQGIHNNYETDLFRTLIETAIELTGTDHPIHSHRVIADHLRASAFLIADGILPANEGRGYVLRRIMRRAMRHAHILGAKDLLLYRLVPTLTNLMGTAYPELIRAEAQIISILKNEEEKFRQTLGRGLKLLQEELARLPAKAPLRGDIAFKLYDTYGFPLDLTQDVLKASNHDVDLTGFQIAMDQQRSQARAAWVGSGETKDDFIWYDVFQTFGATEFLGYDAIEGEGIVLALIKDQKPVDVLRVGECGFLVTNQTPFYGESGGQMGDTGHIESSRGKAIVQDTQKKVGSLIVHCLTVSKGQLTLQDSVKLNVDEDRRKALRANHSATHLLHAALRQVLGTHVMQKGSLVAPDLLRFDFAHNTPLTSQDIEQVEDIVNKMTLDNHPVTTKIMSPDEAIEAGAMALFGERYGEEVRVLSMGQSDGQPFSVELCGGTHVTSTGNIGVFKIVSEIGIAAGVRRIVAKTGLNALADFRTLDHALDKIVGLLKTTPAEAVERVQALIKDKRDLDRQLSDLRRNAALHQPSSKDQDESEIVGAFRVTTKIFQDLPAKDLKSLVDNLKSTLGSGVIIVASVMDDKVSLVIGVTSDLTSHINAVDLVRLGSEILGGKGGGGRPDLAQAGGIHVEAIPQAVAAVKTALMGLS